MICKASEAFEFVENQENQPYHVIQICYLVHDNSQIWFFTTAV